MKNMKRMKKPWKTAVAEAVMKNGPRKVIEGSGEFPEDITQDFLREKCGTGYDSHIASRDVILANEKGLSVSYESLRAKRRGRTFFTKVESVLVARIYGNRLIFKDDYNLNNAVKALMDAFGVPNWRKGDKGDRRDWTPADALVSVLSAHPFLLKAVLTGEVYSDETLYRFWAKRAYGLKNICWKTFRDYIAEKGNSRNWIAVSDLQAFTKDAEASMRVWLDSENRVILHDIVEDAILDGSTVNFRWSQKRLDEMHVGNVRRRMAKEIAKLKQEPLYENVPDTRNDDIHLLNSELEVYEEGLSMHHCIYTHYFYSIQRHDYLGFRMETPQRCTFGVNRDCNGNATVNQIYLCYNQAVSEQTRRKADDFVRENNDTLLALLSSPALSLASPAPIYHGPVGDDDLPF